MQNQPRRQQPQRQQQGQKQVQQGQPQRQPQRQMSEEEARQEYWRRQREMYQDPKARAAEIKHRKQVAEAIEDPEGKRYNMALPTAVVILSLILIVMIAGLIALVMMSQPKPKVTTLADLEPNGFSAINDTPDPRGEVGADNVIPDIPVLFDKIIISSPITAEVVQGGRLVINQIVGTERIQVAEFLDVRPNVEIELKVLGSLAVQNASYEYRMAEPIVYADGTRAAFHAYLLNYNWERDSYLRAMAPSDHPVYVLAPGEEPDFLELIESGIAERTKDDLVRHGDTLVTLEKKEQMEAAEAANANVNANANANENANANGNANGNGNANANVNANENGTSNANGNANGNANTNGNENTNANANNTNKNANANDNANTNANANSNQQNHTT